MKAVPKNPGANAKAPCQCGEFFCCQKWHGLGRKKKPKLLNNSPGFLPKFFPFYGVKHVVAFFFSVNFTRWWFQIFFIFTPI